MKFDIDYIEKLAKVIEEKELTEISLEDGEQAITIRKDYVIQSAAPAVPVSIQPTSVSSSSAPISEPQKPASVPSEEKNIGTPITSPMVGTFYMAPSPDAEPFVSVGNTVKQGDVVCIIEAMKMMNEIKAEIAGKVVEVCVEDGQPVEYGQVLMYVE